MELKTDEEISAYYRGALIQKTIDLELRMEITIGRFLSMNNQERVLDLIEIFDIAKIDFSQKTRILSYIIKKHFKYYLKEKGDFIDDRSKFLSDLNKIMERRNELAHRRHDFNNSNYLKLSWTKIHDSKLKKGSLNITEEFYNEFDKMYNRLYALLIEMEIKVCEIK